MIGNAGSFFKNPEITESKLEELKSAFNDIPFYPCGNGIVKIPAGWLIEKCGWKGRTFDNYGVHKNQALVLVNYGGAKGEYIVQLSKDIQYSIKQGFGIDLEAEVNVI